MEGSSAGEGRTTYAGPFFTMKSVTVPLQILRNCDAQESEGLHCWHRAVHNGEWGESKGVSPEVHSFEHVELQVVKTALDSRLLNLLSVSKQTHHHPG